MLESHCSSALAPHVTKLLGGVDQQSEVVEFAVVNLFTLLLAFLFFQLLPLGQTLFELESGLFAFATWDGLALLL